MVGESIRDIWLREYKQHQLGEYAQRYKDKTNLSNSINLEEDGILLTPESFLLFNETSSDEKIGSHFPKWFESTMRA